ncbi:MAG: dihydrodipicolinate synthase family protein, partial [Planctomycetota bacterium]
MKPTFPLIAASHTPFDRHGELLLDSVRQQADHLRSVGVAGVLIAGSTGEGPSLTSAERHRLAEAWVDAGDSLDVMVQVGHASLREAADLARHAADAGADAICAAPPSWFKIESAKSLAQSCAEIAAGAPDLPFYYYHIPVLSSVQVAVTEFLAEAQELIPSLAGVKFTHDDVEDFRACVAEFGDAVQLLWGTDEALLTGLQAGAHGAVGSTYNFATPLYRRLLSAYHSGDMGTASEMQERSIRLV